jgi:HEAT repeat protein
MMTEPGAAPALIEALEDDAAIANMAEQTLEHIPVGQKTDVPALAEALQASRKVQGRTIAARLLGSIGPDARPAVGSLTAASKDPEPVVRKQCAVALGKIGPRAWPAVPTLAGLLRDKEIDVRNAAATALGQIGPEAKLGVTRLIQSLQDPSVRAPATRALVKIGKEGVPYLIAALAEKGDYRSRVTVMEVLGAIGPDAQDAHSALSLLAVQHPYESVRQAARDALAKINRKLE